MRDKEEKRESTERLARTSFSLILALNLDMLLEWANEKEKIYDNQLLFKV